MTIYAPGARQEQTQRQTLTPRLQEAVRLLQLSSLDFAQEVRQAVSTNPFLEADENDSDVAPAAEPVAGSDGAASDAGESNSLDTSAAAETPWESSNWSQFGQRNGHSGDVDSDIGEITPAVPSLHEHLRTDLGLLTLSDRDRVIAATLIEALDDDGYLRIGLDEVARLTDLSPEPEEDEMHVALRIVQSLEPGVAARDLRECLQLQLQARRALGRACGSRRRRPPRSRRSPKNSSPTTSNASRPTTSPGSRASCARRRRPSRPLPT
jgi:RNA polymerase sigma-54 factor